ncbi:MAG: T9SS type A sorting domain-containing protein [Flavobacteriales bacterium]|nr:T9SS type A sorting domain-containing protein [Flavobacteriales bacterium]
MITDASGRIVAEMQGDQVQRIPHQELAPGAYFISLLQNQEVVTVLKVVK